MNKAQSTINLDPKTLKSLGAALYHESGENAAFRAWLQKLNRNEKAPRGRFFHRRQKLPTIIFDEAWQCIKQR